MSYELCFFQDGQSLWGSLSRFPPRSHWLELRVPWTEEPGRLQSMGSLRFGHDWETSLSFFTFMHWRRKWQPTPVFLPGESQGRGSLVGCCLWGCTESDTTEVTQQQQQQIWVYTSMYSSIKHRQRRAALSWPAETRASTLPIMIWEACKNLGPIFRDSYLFG